MKPFLGLISVLAFTAPVTADTPKNLRPRETHCGKDVFHTEVICIEGKTECCTGSLQKSCMPVGYKCCPSGFFRHPKDSCDPRPDPCRPGQARGANKTKAASGKKEEKDSAAPGLLIHGLVEKAVPVALAAAVLVVTL